MLSEAAGFVEGVGPGEAFADTAEFQDREFSQEEAPSSLPGLDRHSGADTKGP
jgi:hypothetical protein